ncbi:MAG: recombination regulator RecX [Oscillospiraceae bacterium]|jgi:regulatory protein|nr:recombination regulator RecX [Oscillospiraceae bacterium]
MSIVLDIKRQRGAVRLTLDDGPALLIPTPLYRERTVRLGSDLDVEAYRAWMAERGRALALDTAVRYLAARPRTRWEVAQRLTQAGYGADACEQALARLERGGYLNDAQFADMWTQTRAGRGFGSARIARELAEKGVERQQAADALAQVDAEDAQRAAKIQALKLLRRVHGRDEADTRRKVIAALARRGYNLQQARLALAQALKET